jgi:hypothetical protein
VGLFHIGMRPSWHRPRLARPRLAVLVLAAGLLALALTAAAVLMQRAPRRAGTNMVPDIGLTVTVGPSQKLCQAGETLPPDTASLAIRAVASSERALPALRVLVSAGNRTAVAGALGAGRRSGTVWLALARVAGELDDATVCVSDRGSEPVSIGGAEVASADGATLDGTRLSGRMRIEYMRPGRESWLQLLPTLIHRLSLGKSNVVRTWAACAVLALVIVAIALGAVAVLGEGRRVTRAACLCTLAALANGLAWSLIVPPFQVPDELAHYAYVQQLVERGTLPRQQSPAGPLSPRENAMLAALGTFQIVEHPENPALETRAQQQEIEAVADRHLSARGDGDALTATNNPPLYYAVQAIPYKLAGAGVLDKLALMRCVSALMGAITILLVFMFLRELLPGTPWAWPTGALLAALQPLFGFMSGGVNNDDLLYLAAAGMLWAIARMFRRGLGPGEGVLLGGFLGLGLVAKLTLLGFVPAALLAVTSAAWRVSRRDVSPEVRARTRRGVVVSIGLAAGPILLFMLLDRFVWSRGVIPGGIGGVPPGGGRSFRTGEEVAHILQLFLPSLGMHRQFAYLPLWDTWFKGLFGRFGWLDYGFPAWFYKAALAVSAIVCALAAAELVRSREVLHRRGWELAVYALAALGLCVEIGVESYRYLIINGGVFQQARYLLPLLGLYAALGALAVRFAGPRRGPALAAALVVLAIGHDLYAQAITVARYYA